ncbi:venom serine carboxypeptidase [Folsomia candida]|uniref:venom serine carboxypeptidase n=1 Tax=Folsomia candida TaxID=158441 RepID=UPI000B8EEE7F|nr:venom serine carboxypeptidase [Folsomia candida]
MIFLKLLVFATTLAHYAKCQTEGPLFLTPLIKSGRILEAQNLSLVRSFYAGVTSYSGFITVRDDYNSNLFFWYFPAVINSSSAPVLLWSEGGPGVTGFHSIFNHNGPFAVDGDQNLTTRNNSWHQTRNIIFLDSPVNVGFSFTESEAGNIHSGPEAAPDIYEFLIQFFKLFPYLQGNDFYNGGVSYGATYATVLANYIHERNQESPELRINLKGLLLESPWVDPYSQTDYGAYLLNVGLIEEADKQDFDIKRDNMKTLITSGDYVGAFGIWSKLIGIDVTNVVGYSPLYHINRDQVTNFNFTDFVASEQARDALHVGNVSFSWVSPLVQSNMNANFMMPVKNLLENILDTGLYKVIIFVGNMDVITGHLGVQQTLSNLNWEGRDELKNSTRGIWHVDGRVAGYVHTARNVTHVLIRNAGHGTNGDQPIWGLDLVNKFMAGLPLVP